MTTTNLTTAENLRWIAAQLAESSVDATVTIQIQPEDLDDIDAVDLIAAALGLTTEDRRLSAGSWHRRAQQQLGAVSLSVFTAIPEPVAEKRERLAAELAALDAQIEANGGGS